MSDELVNRCECIGKTFAALKTMGSLESIRASGAGLECKGCLPYIKLMLATGETELELEDPRLEEFE